MKRIALFAMGLVLYVTAPAQEKVETTIGADMVSQYIWRGQNLGSTALQPTLGIGYKGLSFSAWGSYGLTNPEDTKEMDLTASYTVGGFNIGITDYWFNTPEERYFLYDAHHTSHIFEATAGYDCGAMSLQWYTNFAGNDGTNKVGKRAYSSYLEMNAPFSFGGAEWTATAGAAAFGTTLYGTTGFAVTNLALKATRSIGVSDGFSIPVFGQVAVNPCSQKAYLIFGLTLHP